MTPREKLLAWLLRITAVVLLSAVLAVVMPTSWMRAISDALGFAELPATPLVEYLTRSLSALYAALGAYVWHLASDVRRYMPLLRLGVPVSLVFSITLIAVDLAAAMPLAWTVGEAAFLLPWTLALWWLTRSPIR